MLIKYMQLSNFSRVENLKFINPIAFYDVFVYTVYKCGDKWLIVEN